MSHVGVAFPWIADYNSWCHRVAATPTGGLVFAGCVGLGFSLDDPLLLASLLDGLFRFSHFLGGALGTIALMYGGVTIYGLYARVPFRKE